MSNRKIISIANKVTFLRKYDNLSIRELSAELRFRMDHIADLETGAVQADLEDVIRYCDFFGVDYEGFLFDEFAEFKAAYIADNEKMMKTIGYSV